LRAKASSWRVIGSAPGGFLDLIDVAAQGMLGRERIQHKLGVGTDDHQEIVAYLVHRRLAAPAWRGEEQLQKEGEIGYQIGTSAVSGRGAKLASSGGSA
jgi:hypothetical protein